MHGLHACMRASVHARVCECVCVCVCVSLCDFVRVSLSLSLARCLCVCVCVCGWLVHVREFVAPRISARGSWPQPVRDSAEGQSLWLSAWGMSTMMLAGPLHTHMRTGHAASCW